MPESDASNFFKRRTRRSTRYHELVGEFLASFWQLPLPERRCRGVLSSEKQEEFDYSVWSVVGEWGWTAFLFMFDVACG